MACVLFRKSRTAFKGVIFSRRKADRRDVDHISRRARFEHRAGDPAVRLSAPRPGRARRRIVRGLSAAPELSRWALQAGKARLACCLPDRDVALLHRSVGPSDPVDPRLSRRMTGGPHGATAGNTARYYRAAANGANTSRQAGERSAARLAMHCMMRPPPGATPAHSV